MKSKIIIAVLLVLIIAIILVALLTKNKVTKTNNSGDPIISTIDNSDNKDLNEEDEDEGYNTPIPDDYIQIAKDNINNETAVVAENIAYTYNSGEDTTYVNVYIRNDGKKTISKKSVCVIELYNSADEMIYNIGGVMENSSDLKAGGRTLIRTQFIGEPKDIKYAKVSFDFAEITHEGEIIDFANSGDEVFEELSGETGNI